MNAISNAFRAAYENHPARDTDPALAIQSACETASEMVPAGVTGTFDAESLTFTFDPCPRCGAKLLAFSPSGLGRAACDDCGTYWE